MAEDRCYSVPGVGRVRASKPPSPQAQAALRELADAVQRMPVDPEQQARYEAGQQRIRERNARLRGATS